MDNQVHTIDDVLARARYQLDVLKERYPAVYRVFVQSAFYDHTAAWWELLTEYGVDSAAVEDFSDEMNAMLEAMWEKYGPGGSISPCTR